MDEVMTPEEEERIRQRTRALAEQRRKLKQEFDNADREYRAALKRVQKERRDKPSEDKPK